MYHYQMRHLALFAALLGFLVITNAGADATPKYRLSISYVSENCSVTTHFNCDWMLIVSDTKLKPFIVWGRSDIPNTPSEALLNATGARKSGWTCVSLRPIK